MLNLMNAFFILAMFGCLVLAIRVRLVRRSIGVKNTK